jgi:hypothetical protein
MFDQIRDVAGSLGIRDGQLVKLARDIAHDGALLDLEYMREADALELLAFLRKARLYEARELIPA